jgi:hypothetical protein
MPETGHLNRSTKLGALLAKEREALEAWQRVEASDPRESAVSRARWLFSFARRDFESLSEREEEDCRRELFAFLVDYAPGSTRPTKTVNGQPVPGAVYRSEVDFAFFLNRATHLPGSRELLLPVAETRALHDWLASGIQVIDGGQAWEPQVSFRPRYMWWAELGRFVAGSIALPGVLERFASLVDRIFRDVQDRIRRCASCRAIFLPKKRQAYCSKRCSQQERTKRFQQELGGPRAFSDRRHEYYLSKVERVRGKAAARHVRRRQAPKEIQQ